MDTTISTVIGIFHVILPLCPHSMDQKYCFDRRTKVVIDYYRLYNLYSKIFIYSTYAKSLFMITTAAY